MPGPTPAISPLFGRKRIQKDLPLDREIGFTPLVAFVVVLATVPFAKAAGARLGIVAQPSADRPHSKPIPILGGVAIVTGFVVAITLASDFSKLPRTLLWLIAITFAMFLVGLVDDLVELRPRRKLLLEFLAIGLLALWGPRLDLLPFQWANLALTILWLMTAANAFNLIDGLDGLAAGVGMVASLGVAAVAALHQHQVTMLAAVALSGALAGFMVFNYSSASIFMGDQGALTVGLILGVLSIQVSHSGEGSLPARLAMLVLTLAVPLMDMATVTVTRLATGNPISKRGLDHTHHRLIRLGMSPARATGLMIVLQAMAAACMIGLSIVRGYEAVLLIPFIVLFFALITLFLMDRSFIWQPPSDNQN